jgi:hypothetical protein
MWTGIEEVTLGLFNPLREKGKFSVDKLWKLTRKYFNEDGQSITEYSMGGFTTQQAALNALGDQTNG